HPSPGTVFGIVGDGDHTLEIGAHTGSRLRKQGSEQCMGFLVTALKRLPPDSLHGHGNIAERCCTRWYRARTHLTSEQPARIDARHEDRLVHAAPKRRRNANTAILRDAGLQDSVEEHRICRLAHAPDVTASHAVIAAAHHDQIPTRDTPAIMK